MIKDKTKNHTNHTKKYTTKWKQKQNCTRNKRTLIGKAKKLKIKLDFEKF